MGVWASVQVPCLCKCISHTARPLTALSYAARNVLVSASFVAKISDFGMARRSYRSEYYAASESRSLTAGSLVLPMRWMAPESYFDGTWDVRSDVWMFGVLLWGLQCLSC